MSDHGTLSAFTKVEDDPRPPEEILANTVRAHPIELEEPIETLDRPLVIECACPGWQSRTWPAPEVYDGDLPPNYGEEGGVRYSAVPCTIEEQADAIVEAAEAGCAAAHIHPRDPEDCVAMTNEALVAEIYERIYEATDVVPLQHSWTRTADGGMDFIEPAEGLLDAADGRNRYLQGGLFLWPPNDYYPRDYETAVREGLEYYVDHGIHPIHKIRGSYHARKLERSVVRGGLPNPDPMVIIHDMGHPFGWPMDQDPWPPIELVSTLEQTRQRFDDPVVGVYTGNRNWMPTAMMAILAGVDVVRIGIEDFYWMYPHRDEVIQRNIDCIRKITDFCDLIGRELADAEQAREILGIEVT